ncbi:hypothetical protein AK812_SmicGene9424 [Symbiodinium microadriaticum]|uniref:Uncharacterized protein n=1 Tax=Symbiodinium microadriaticum TaxID=2951 RepID=A0A1Q9EIG1_SYMMI|nr:hypothetical protein AK812_SmicGene9424 [Symbiodinium microadriaticum]
MQRCCLLTEVPVSSAEHFKHNIDPETVGQKGGNTTRSRDNLGPAGKVSSMVRRTGRPLYGPLLAGSFLAWAGLAFLTPSAEAPTARRSALLAAAATLGLGAAAEPSRAFGEDPSDWFGYYSDPNHPGCPRKITYDEDGNGPVQAEFCAELPLEHFHLLTTRIRVGRAEPLLVLLGVAACVFVGIDDDDDL